MSVHDEARDAVAAASRRLAAEGLLVGTAGNVSVRVPGTDDVVVTASGVELTTCTPDECVVVDLAGERSSPVRLQPTSELALHRGLYADTSAAAVVHTHAPYATALACVLPELPVIHYQQLLLGGTIRVAPYATFGSLELAAGVREALSGRQAALMGNHGSVAIGASLDQAVQHAVLLEWLATLHHRASVLGRPRVLTDEEQTDVVLAALSRNYGNPTSQQENQE